MTSRYVRTEVRNWLLQGNVPYYDTVNLEQNPTDPIWSTVDWGYADRQMTTYCHNHVEEGSFNVVFFGDPGVGDDALLAAAEADMDLLLLRVDPNARLTLTNYNAPFSFRQEEHFALEFNVTYEYQT